MILQLNRTKFFIIVIFLLHFIVFYNNYYLLIYGKISNGEILSYYNSGTRSNNRFAEIEFRYGNYIYTFSGQSNVNYNNSDIKIIFDPKEPSNSYEYSFFGFYFERLLLLVILTLTIVLPIYFLKLKKNSYLILDIKNKKFYFGKNNWNEDELIELTKFLKQIETPIQFSATEYYFLLNKNNMIYPKVIQLKLQEYCLNESVYIYHKRIKLNQFDSKYFKRPFFQLKNNIDFSNIQNSDYHFLKIFKEKQTLRQHEIHQRLKLLYGLDYEIYVEQILAKELKQKGFYQSENSLKESTKNNLKKITQLLNFIDENINALIENHPTELTKLLIYLKSIILLLSPETFKHLRSYLKNLNQIIPQELFNQLPNYSQNNNYLIPISMLADSSSFEANYNSISFDGGDFGGGGSGGDW